MFINQGEVCSAGSRILVERSIYKKVVDAMVEKARGIRLGPGLDRRTKMGPLVSQEQLDRVLYLQVKQVHINLNERPIGWYVAPD